MEQGSNITFRRTALMYAFVFGYNGVVELLKSYRKIRKIDKIVKIKNQKRGIPLRNA
jgi:hypothetical protein